MSLSATTVGTMSRVDIGIALVKGEMAGNTRNLVGRRHECEELDNVVARARAGSSPVLVLRGEPGAGKTSLLEHAIGSASDLRVIDAVGIESEMQLGYAALHQLCAPVLDRLGQLPQPQRNALGTAFGHIAGHVADRFLVGLATLTLLAEAADEQPMLCAIDDAQWLDVASAQALAFVARRLDAHSVGMVFAIREPRQELKGLPELVVEGLSDNDARELLRSVVAGPLDPRVRERMVAEARGNPLALVELARALSPAELAGSVGVTILERNPAPIEDSFRRQIEALPDEARLFLLVAAADPVGDPALIRRAAKRLGVTSTAACAHATGLMEIGSVVRFRHPLVRSAVYRAASAADHQRAHAALADATDPDLDPDRLLWHRAKATSEPEADVATELERSTSWAKKRGGLAAAAAFRDRAVEMTLDSEHPAQRALIRVALADDEVLLREGLAGLLERAGLEVVGQSGNARELIELVRQRRPELVVVDIRMPPTNSTEGLDAARLIREEFPQTAIMILSAHVEVEHAMDLLAAGGSSGYLLKSRVTDVEEFIDALQRIVKGGSVIDPVLVRELVAAKRVDDPLDEISPREREVLTLVAQGRSNAGIAKQLWVTEGTVEKHVHSILGKLNLPKAEDDHQRVLAVLAFLDTRESWSHPG